MHGLTTAVLLAEPGQAHRPSATPWVTLRAACTLTEQETGAETATAAAAAEDVPQATIRARAAERQRIMEQGDDDLDLMDMADDQ